MMRTTAQAVAKTGFRPYMPIAAATCHSSAGQLRPAPCALDLGSLLESIREPQSAVTGECERPSS